jgi:hypothetical protein
MSAPSPPSSFFSLFTYERPSDVAPFCTTNVIAYRNCTWLGADEEDDLTGRNFDVIEVDFNTNTLSLCVDDPNNDCTHIACVLSLALSVVKK